MAPLIPLLPFIYVKGSGTLGPIMPRNEGQTNTGKPGFPKFLTPSFLPVGPYIEAREKTFPLEKG